MAYWLVKSEEEVYSIDDLRQDKVTAWDGVRNYQARNYLREMQVGEQVLFYHSSSELVGVVGLAQVKRVAYPDPTQFDRASDYYDPQASKEEPRWYSPDLAFVQKFSSPVSIAALRRHPKLQRMVLLQRGNRLSVLPLQKEEFQVVVGLAESPLGDVSA